MVKTILIAANTPAGFVSYFGEYISADKVICLKGGSGVGKSTLLKGIIAAAHSRNMSVLSMPCSSDIKSLDMVMVGDNKIVVLDATAPHVIEPPAYGVQGEIFNLGDFLDRDKLSGYKEELLELIHDKSLHYKSLYNHLRAAQCHIDNIGISYRNALNNEVFGDILARLIADHVADAAGAERGIKAFNSYLSCTEIVDYAENLVDNRVVISIRSASNSISRQLLGEVVKYLSSTGITAELYYSLLYPEQVDSIGLKDIFITISSKPIADYTIDLDAAIDSSKIGHRIVDIIDERGSANREIAKAGDRLRQSRACHAKIEEYYIEAMNFSKLESAKANLLSKLF